MKNREYTHDLWNIRLLDKGLLYEKLGLIIFFWIGTHQNLVGLTIFKSDESWDSPF